jgi:hypothetical protein
VLAIRRKSGSVDLFEKTNPIRGFDNGRVDQGTCLCAQRGEETDNAKEKRPPRCSAAGVDNTSLFGA